MDSLTTVIIVGRGRMGSCVRRLVEEAPDMHFVASYDENDAFKFTLTGEYKGQTINFEANNAGDVLENNGQAVTFAPVKFT
ncbi:MAG: hypothetical protein GX481_05370, partial [Atopobium sp.]|nr:hypothetical protein [Atopobium sp.]